MSLQEDIDKGTTGGGEKIEAATRRVFGTLKIGVGVAQIWATIVAPIFEALFLSNLADIKSAVSAATKPVSIWVLWILFIGIVVSQIAAALFVYFNAKERIGYFEYSDLKKKFEDLIKIYKAQKSRYRALKAMGQAEYLSSIGLEDFFGLLSDDENIDNNVIKKHLKSILYPIINFREEIFNFRAESLWNFALFLHCQETDKLRVYFRKNDDRLIVRNRTWRPGWGHVGLSFIQKDLKLSKDVSKSAELSKNNTGKDAENYKSIVSVPILHPNDTHDSDRNPIGVLVITSSSDNQFDERVHKDMLLTFSKILAIFFSTALSKCEGDLEYENETE